MTYKDNWEKFHKNLIFFNNQSNRGDADEFINSNQVAVHNFKSTLNYIGFNNTSLKHLNKLNSDRFIYLRTIGNILKGEGFNIESPLSEKRLCSINSIGTQLFNFILFKDGDEFFYIVQNHQIVAGVYRPLTNEYIQFSGGNINGYLRFLKKIFIQDPNKISRERKVFNLMFSCPRPWHFFYNQATALSILSNSKELIDKSITFGYLPGGDFLCPSEISSKFIYKKTSLRDMQDGKQAPFLIGISFDSISIEEHNALREKVLKSVEVKNEAKNTLNLWVGITSQKRKWIEQVEGVSKLIELMSNKGIPLHIYFDGWTSPMTPSSSDQINIDSDLGVVDEIIKRTKNAQFTYTSIIGFNPKDKIRTAMNSDLYVANYASGSIFVSRFAGLRGLSHLNNNMERSHHIHYQNQEINKSLVTDIKEVGKNGHHVSYSIKVNDFISEFESFFNNTKISHINYLKLGI